ncbi:hypothetical protein PR202_ga29476 [Eleusine coracana subsp. coracana]|uniref:DUF295 domain-containing protein n=1 Tax=Eleusine coracana subsp. coracana TaxID=191504 RepID=A0AAV5DLH6_ELECO|nr:hypothetical protein PR202_ga29476 [Eleusine coracana subsp. coracana]
MADRPSARGRDWANLADGPAGLIADRLLDNDVADYVRFRAVCAPWRACSDDPQAQSVFNRRYHPRRWIIARHSVSVRSQGRRLLNVSTGELISMRVPDRRRYLVLGPTAEGFLLLCRKGTLVVQLLNPLTGRFYCATPWNVLVLQQAAAACHLKPQLVVAANNRFDTKPWRTSYICLVDNNEELILTRCCREYYIRGHFDKCEAYRVDMDEGKTVAMPRVDDRALFISCDTGRALSVSAGLSPSICANAIYICKHEDGKPGLNFDIWRLVDGSVAKDCRTKQFTCSIVDHLTRCILQYW